MPSTPNLRRRVTVSGRVQGVGFRQSCADQARRQQVAGWVRNRRSGAVEAVFEGRPAAVVAMVEWCRTGPGLAAVTAVDVSNEEPEGLMTFVVADTY
jgi:acylphosphatase